MLVTSVFVFVFTTTSFNSSRWCSRDISLKVSLVNVNTILLVSQAMCLISIVSFPSHKLLNTNSPSKFEVANLFKLTIWMDAPTIEVLSWKSLTLPLSEYVQFWA